jgi:hypothetical protein
MKEWCVFTGPTAKKKERKKLDEEKIDENPGKFSITQNTQQKGKKKGTNKEDPKFC